MMPDLMGYFAAFAAAGVEIDADLTESDLAVESDPLEASVFFPQDESDKTVNASAKVNTCECFMVNSNYKKDQGFKKSLRKVFL